MTMGYQNTVQSFNQPVKTQIGTEEIKEIV